MLLALHRGELEAKEGKDTWIELPLWKMTGKLRLAFPQVDFPSVEVVHLELNTNSSTALKNGE